MNKFLLFALLLTIVLNGCHGCSSIKEHFTKEQKPIEQDEGQSQQEPEHKVEPIPVNPQHS